MALSRIFSNSFSPVRNTLLITISAPVASLLPNFSSSPNSSPIAEDAEDDDIDLLSSKESVTDNCIHWDFGVGEKEEFLSRPKGRHALPLVHHHGFVCGIPPKHRFVMGKFDGLYNYLMMDRVVAPEQLVRPPAVSASICSLIHDADYIRAFFLGETTEKEQRRTGFKWTPGLVRRCRLETGATILAARLAMETGIACSSGGGTHHAFPSFGSGYCLINDLAIAARFMVAAELVEKVLIVDLDVHQGDGTAFMFREDPSVFTLSVHNEKNFPLIKQQSDLDVSLEDKVEDAEYLKTIVDVLPSVIDMFRPDLVLYDAGTTLWGVSLSLTKDYTTVTNTCCDIFSNVEFLWLPSLVVATQTGGMMWR